MVSGEIKVHKLFSWSRNFNVDTNENVLTFIYYPDADTELHIEPTGASVNILKGLRDQILQFMNQTVTLEGNIVERWEKQLVTYPERQVEEFVRVV